MRKSGQVILMLLLEAAISAESSFSGVPCLLQGLSELTFVVFKLSNSC